MTGVLAVLYGLLYVFHGYQIIALDEWVIFEHGDRVVVKAEHGLLIGITRAHAAELGDPDRKAPLRGPVHGAFSDPSPRMPIEWHPRSAQESFRSAEQESLAMLIFDPLRVGEIAAYRENRSG